MSTMSVQIFIGREGAKRIELILILIQNENDKNRFLCSFYKNSSRYIVQKYSRLQYKFLNKCGIFLWIDCNTRRGEQSVVQQSP